MMHCTDERKQNFITYITCLLYFSLHIFLALRHEAWRDEAQAWVLSRNLSLSELFDVLSVEGHPILWFIICRFFSKLGLSFYFFSLISIMIMTLSVFLLMKYTRLKTATKIIILFSPVFMYYDTVICRVYSVVVLLLTVLALFWKGREKKYIRYALTVFLLSQTHVLVSGVVLGCLVENIVRFFCCIDKKAKKECAISLLIIAAGLLLLFMELYQPKNSTSFITVNLNVILDAVGIVNIKNGIDSLIKWYSETYGFYPFLFRGFVIVGIFLFGYIVSRIKKDYYELIVVVFAVGVYIGIICLVRRAEHIQMAIVFMMIVYFAILIYASKEYDDHQLVAKYVCLILCIITMLTVPKTFSDAYFDFKKEFSGSRKFAKGLEECVEEGSTVVLLDSAYSPAVYSYLLSSSKGLSFYDCNNQEDYRGHIWKKTLKRYIGTEELLDVLKSEFSDKENVYLISNTPIPKEIYLLSCTEDNYWRENYYLYRVH